MSEYYFTEKGYRKLKDEIEKLERYIKQDIAKEIGTAREHGDLRENAEYHAAKEKQMMCMASTSFTSTPLARIALGIHLRRSTQRGTGPESL